MALSSIEYEHAGYAPAYEEDNDMNELPELFTWQLGVVLVVLAGFGFWWVRRARQK